MKRPLAAIATLLFLAGCARTTVGEDLAARLDNPLYAERYYEDLVQHMVSLVIQNDPLTKQPATADIIERHRVDAMRLAQEATAKQAQGKRGNLISETNLSLGEILLLGETVYTSPEFQATPSPSLHVYLTTIVDPRDGEFPDATAVDLGDIKDVIGAQTYVIPQGPEEEQVPYATFVLWDTEFERVYGFAQLR